MEILPVAVAALIAFVVSLGGAWVARRSGLGDISDRLEARFKAFIDQQELELKNKDDEIREITKERDDAIASNTHLREEIVQLKRDLRLTENELLDLYRRTGEKPPARLEGIP